MAYATLSDLDARRPEDDPVPDNLAEQAQTLLEDASTMIDALIGGEVDPNDEQMLSRARMVSCAMVNRALAAAGSDAYGLSEASYAMGPFSQTAHFANPSGDLYFTAREKGLLGAGRGYIRSMRAQVGGAGVV